jgi:UDPglucose 6-dehydrogenase/UDP-N-acetyl-D-galactosamine dehydrogenase
MVPKTNIKERAVCIIGLGYVGMPLALAFSKHLKVIGFDIDKNKIKKFRQVYHNVEFTSKPTNISKADYIIIAVPTPIKSSKIPDLSFVKNASKIVGQNLRRNAIVILESTVYPGVTEEIVGPILEKESGFELGRDFKIGYSPERVNPGDKNHTIDKIIKIVAGMDEDSTKKISELYKMITTVYQTSDIKTAEAAKVIENVQRDLNIALMNELSIIFHRMDLDTKAILDAAATKWNFHKYSPGLVGGHCIPIDPYYLVYKAKEIGYHAQVILAGRSINNYMPKYIVKLAMQSFNKINKIMQGSKILIMGLTFKENIDDIRETPVKKIIKELKHLQCEIYGFDPLLNKEKKNDFGIQILDNLQDIKVDCVIITVIHDVFKELKLDELKQIMYEKPILIDVRGLFSDNEAKLSKFIYHRL